MSNFIKILIAAFLILISNILGYFYAPSSIFITPIIIGIITLIFLSLGFKLIYNIFLIGLAIIVNDILIKKISEGSYDIEGAGWINVFSILGLVTAVIITIFKLTFEKKRRLILEILITALLPVFILCYVYYFNFWGLAYSKQASETKSDSIKSGVFLSDLFFSDTVINYKNDTIKILYGWCEDQRRVNHKSIIRRIEKTGRTNYIIRIKHSLDAHNLLYTVNSEDINGSLPLDSIIKFNTSENISHIYISIFKHEGPISNDTLLKKIKIEKAIMATP
jgi:hypothetical protein